jgi:hypothetical protein
MKNKLLLGEAKNDREVYKDFQLMKQLKSNNVSKERIEFYRDFIINLIQYIHTSYLGKEFIKTSEDVKGHFNWAFNKVLFDLEKEGVSFGETKTLRTYFFDYFLERFYTVETVPSLKSFISYWDGIFTIRNTKEKTETETLILTYKKFDEALNDKNILEKID